MTKVGAPYEWGATGPGSFDCSGLMYWAYSQIGISIPRTSQAQLSGGTPVSRSELQPGDIIGYYPGITHVGMYVGNGQVIHASDYGIPVQVVGIDQAGPYQGAVRY
nr:NlpC/P60 family protein [Corynebacterium sp. TAE3-ERU12]